MMLEIKELTMISANYVRLNFVMNDNFGMLHETLLFQRFNPLTARIKLQFLLSCSIHF